MAGQLTKAELRKKQQRFQRSRKAELEYARSLRNVARQVGVIVKGFTGKNGVENEAQLREALQNYAAILRPWAASVARRMLDDLARRDASMWRELGDEMGKELGKEIQRADVGGLLRQRLDEQVALITSLPLEAAKRVHELTLKGLTEGARSTEIAAKIMETGKVTQSRANLIARTEVARTATELTAARCGAAGVTHAIWRTAGDLDVRESHKKMNGKVFEIANPPIVDGKPLLPGATFNCRCYIEPVIPEDV